MSAAGSAVLRRHARVVLIAALVFSAAPASGQTNVGAGPLTSMLPDAEPGSAAIVWGPLRLAPGVQVREIGWDSNVFFEPENPKEDWVISAMPDVMIFSRLPRMRIAGYAGVDLTYYDTYESERSVSDQYRGRVDFLFSRLRPFVGGGYVSERTRPNGEINSRVNRLETELSGGLAYDLSPTSRFYGAAGRIGTEYQPAEQYQGVPLDQALNRDNHTYTIGVQSALTPLTQLTLSGSYNEDRFRESAGRNAETREVSAEFVFSPQAVLRGTARVGYKGFRSDDPSIEPYTGLVAGAGLAIPVLDAGRFNFLVLRDTQYSFDEAEAYYVENTFDVAYTHFIFGNFDVQARGAWSGYDYGHRAGSPARRDTLTTWSAGVGYNLQNRTRMSVQFENAERHSPTLSESNYDRRRVYFSWMFTL